MFDKSNGPQAKCAGADDGNITTSEILIESFNVRSSSFDSFQRFHYKVAYKSASKLETARELFRNAHKSFLAKLTSGGRQHRATFERYFFRQFHHLIDIGYSDDIGITARAHKKTQ